MHSGADQNNPARSVPCAGSGECSGLTPRNGFIRIESLKNQALIADKCSVAEHFLSRLKGLIGRKSFGSGEGMFFPRCNDIHMWFMSVPIDVVFIRNTKGADGKVNRRVNSVRENLQPWKLMPVGDFGAQDTLELPAGTVCRCGLAPGDELCIS
jgi:uncharacterized protein